MATEPDIVIKHGNIEPARIVAFREARGLDQEGLDRLLGMRSIGRTTRRWEREGAPPYVEVLMAYIEKHGTGEAERLAQLRD